MKNKNIFLFGGVVVLGICIAAGIFFFSTQQNKSVPETKKTLVQEVKNLPSQTTKTYTDDAGFTFSYPDDTTVEKKDSTNSAVYTELTITSGKAEGNIHVLVQDTKVKIPDDWLAKNISSSPSAQKDITLSNLSGKEYMFSDKTTTVIINQGILFTIDTTFGKEKEYWDSVQNTITTNFAFAAPTQAASVSSDTSSDDSGGDVVVEEDDAQ